MKTLVMFFFYFLFSASFLAQQIAHYSNYIDNAFYLNPSISNPLKKQVLLAYRNHWSTFDGAPSTSFISFQSPFSFNSNSKSYSSIGCFLQNDDIGAFNMAALNFSYSYSFLINQRIRVSLGSFMGFQQLGFDATGLESFHPNDPVIDISSYSILAPNLDFGISISNENNFLGFSSKQIFKNNWRNAVKSDLSKNITSYVLLYSNKIKFSEIILSPNLLIDFSPKITPLLLLGLDVCYKNILNIGIATRNEESLVSRLKINISENIHIAYGFEFTYLSKISFGTNAHELMFSYHTSIVEKMKRSKLVSYF
jgi:type IX secretion system PorP/SprF family membrane protein